MKKSLMILSAAVLVMMAVATPVYALVKADDVIIIEKGDVVDDDLFAAGNEVIIKGTVNGDVYAGASRIEVSGTVNGDVIGAANNIIITGEIRDDLRVAGNNISLVAAKIGDSLSVAGNELSIDSKSVVGGGLLFGGRLLALDGSVGRGLMSGNQTTRIDGAVKKDVRVAADNIRIGQNAVIGGDLEYSSKNTADIEGKVRGETIQKEGIDVSTEGMFKWFALGFNIWAYIGALIIGFVSLLVFPLVFKRSNERFLKNPWPRVGWGALFLFAVPPAALLLMITVFGIPLAMIVLLFWAIAILLAKFFVGYTAGFALLRYFKNNDKEYSPNAYLAIFIGLSIYYVLRMIPFVGFLVRLATTIVGFGIMLTLYRRPKTVKTKT